MAELCLPSVDMHSSFLEAMAEFRAEGCGASDDISAIGWEIRDGGWRTTDGFAQYIAALHSYWLVPRQEGWV